MTKMGSAEYSIRHSSKMSQPFIPAMQRSVITNLGLNSASLGRASSPQTAVATVQPSETSTRAKLSRTASSSSINRIIGGGSVERAGDLGPAGWFERWWGTWGGRVMAPVEILGGCLDLIFTAETGNR